MRPGGVMRALLADDEGRETRQVGIVDGHRRAATFTGAECIGWAGGRRGDGYAAQGNCLAGPAVVDALAETFERARGPLSYRLVAALAAAQEAGGRQARPAERGPHRREAGRRLRGFNDRYVDLRVDDHPAPIAELRRILDLHALYFFRPNRTTCSRSTARSARRSPARWPGSAHLTAPRSKTRAGGYDERVRGALVAYMHVENLENRVRTDGAIDRQTLDYLRAARPPG